MFYHDRGESVLVLKLVAGFVLLLLYRHLGNYMQLDRPSIVLLEAIIIINKRGVDAYLYFNFSIPNISVYYTEHLPVP